MKYDSFEFEDFYRKMFDRLKALANSKLNDLEASEDIVQETFLVFSEQLRRDDLRIAFPKAYIKDILRKKVQHEFRARSRFALLLKKLEEAYQVEGVADVDDRIGQIEEIVSKQELDLLKLVHVDKYTVEEAANISGLSADACKKRIQRAKQKIIESTM